MAGGSIVSNALSGATFTSSPHEHGEVSSTPASPAPAESESLSPFSKALFDSAAHPTQPVTQPVEARPVRRGEVNHFAAAVEEGAGQLGVNGVNFTPVTVFDANTFKQNKRLTEIRGQLGEVKSQRESAAPSYSTPEVAPVQSSERVSAAAYTERRTAQIREELKAFQVKNRTKPQFSAEGRQQMLSVHTDEGKVILTSVRSLLTKALQAFSQREKSAYRLQEMRRTAKLRAQKGPGLFEGGEKKGDAVAEMIQNIEPAELTAGE